MKLTSRSKIFKIGFKVNHKSNSLLVRFMDMRDGRGVLLSVRAVRAGSCRILLDPVRSRPIPRRGIFKDNVWEIRLDAGESVSL